MATAAAPGGDDQPSYIDYEAFLAPDFAPAAFANALVVATNNPNDSPLDLSTPLSRVLFDAQELDSHLELVTTRSAVPLLEFTRTQTSASTRIITELDAQIQSLNDSYQQLEREVIHKHAEADEVRRVALRLWDTLRLGRSVGRCLQLGRQLQLQHSERGGPEDHGALVRCSHTILGLREVLDNKAPGQEGHGLAKVDAIHGLLDSVVAPIERSVRETAQSVVADFSLPASLTFSQGDEVRARLESAMAALYLLSPTAAVRPDRWTPRLLLQALEAYVRSALQTSVSSLSRALGQLPALDRALADATARCQDLVSLELILESAKPPTHALLPPSTAPDNLIQLLLAHLETGSLPSYFWRTMAVSLTSRVRDIVARAGVVARLLRANKNAVGDAIRQAVVKGCQPPAAMAGERGQARAADANWDREVAVMVGSVVNNLGR